MSTLNSKIISLKEVGETKGEKLVICYGYFNIIHPGHIRYLEYASRLGARLVVLVLGDAAILETQRKHHFQEAERAESVAAIQIVDQVILLGERTLKDAVLLLKPSHLVLGKEFEYEEHEQVRAAVELSQAQSCEVLYHAGETHYASAGFLRDSQPDLQEQRHRLFLKACERQGFRIEELLMSLDKFQDSSLLVLGDTIVDRYIACDAIGMSAEAPVIVARELETRDYVGGAAIVALHAKALGARCSYLSVVGRDQNALLVKDELDRRNVEHVLIEDGSRPTTTKIRYMVENQKMFRVSRLVERNIPRQVEEQLITELSKQASGVRGIIISDFVYGVITPRVIKVINELVVRDGLLVFGDLQCSSQVGNIAKFMNFHLLSPTEKEARIALDAKDEGLEWVAKTLIEKTQVRNLIMKLGSEGFITYGTEMDGYIYRQHFPALNPNPMDVTGAGDSLLAALAVGLCSGVPLMQSSALGACMAAHAVQAVGNIPISSRKLKSYLRNLTLDQI